MAISYSYSDFPITFKGVKPKILSLTGRPTQLSKSQPSYNCFCFDFFLIFIIIIKPSALNAACSLTADQHPLNVILCAGGGSHSGRTGLSIWHEQNGAWWVRHPAQSSASQPAGRVWRAACSAAVQHSGTSQCTKPYCSSVWKSFWWEVDVTC